MAYSGGLAVGVARAEAGQVYRMLRSALCAVPDELPLRGPGMFESEGLRYTCSLSGTLERFQGQEFISRQDLVLYDLQFIGGVLA